MGDLRGSRCWFGSPKSLAPAEHPRHWVQCRQLLADNPCRAVRRRSAGLDCQSATTSYRCVWSSSLQFAKGVEPLGEVATVTCQFFGWSANAQSTSGRSGIGLVDEQSLAKFIELLFGKLRMHEVSVTLVTFDSCGQIRKRPPS